MRRPGLILLGTMLVAIVAPGGARQPLGREAAVFDAARRRAIAAEAEATALEARADTAERVAAKARADAATIAGRIQAGEAVIATARTRLATIAAAQHRQRARIAARQGPIVRLAGALHTLARRPPALALVQPGSIADMIHARSLLAAGLPAIAARTAGLRAELAAGERLRLRQESTLAELRDGQHRLAADRLALVRLEAANRARATRFTDAAMLEQDRALAMGEEARDIVALMRAVEASAAVGARLATLPGPIPRPPIPGRSVAPPAEADPTLRAATRLRYRLPVVGRVVAGMGEISTAGARARGVTLRPLPGAQVVAPAAGRIAFAGDFKGYGRIVIVDHGNDWTSLVTGIDRLGVRVGDRVDRGGPIGRASMRDPAVTIELRHGGEAVDVVALATRG